MKARRLAGLAAAAALVAGLATGCSSSGSGTASSGSTATGGTASGQSVTVGLMGQYSGPLASSWAGLPAIANAWASAVNTSGGLDGHTVHVVTEDTAAGVQPGLGDAKELIGQDHAIAIIDTDLAPDDSTWLPYAKAQNVPVIVATPGSVGALADALAFPVLSYAPVAVYSFAAQAKTLGPKFGIVYCAEEAACAANAVLLKSIGASIGSTLAVSVSASSSSPDYTAVCQDLKSGGVGSYYAEFGSAAAQRVADTCYQQGLHVPQLLTAGTAAPYWKTDPAFRDDPVLDETEPYWASATPAEKAYREALAKYAPSVVGTNLDDAAGMWVWAAGQLVAAAAHEESGPVTAASIISGLYAMKNETLGGLVQPLTYTQGKPTWPTCYFVWNTGSNGQYTMSSDTPVCASSAVIASVTKPFLK